MFKLHITFTTGQITACFHNTIEECRAEYKAIVKSCESCKVFENPILCAGEEPHTLIEIKGAVKVERAKCDRCGGSGIFFVRVHNGVGVPAQPDAGVCYRCRGTGFEPIK